MADVTNESDDDVLVLGSTPTEKVRERLHCVDCGQVVVVYEHGEEA